MRGLQVRAPAGDEATAILGPCGDGAEQPRRCARMSLPLAWCAVLVLGAVLGAVALICASTSARPMPARRSDDLADPPLAFEYPALGGPPNPEGSIEDDNPEGIIEDESKKKRVLAECTIDVDHATNFLIEAGNFINYATFDNCSAPVDAENGRLCAVEVTTVITSFVMVAMYISEAVSNCAGRENVGAVCSRNITMLTDLLSEFAITTSTLRTACQLNVIEPDEVADVRRLWGLSNASKRAAGVQRLQVPDVRRLRSLSNASRGAAGVQRHLASAAPRQTPLERAKTFYGQYEKKLKADAAKIRALSRPHPPEESVAPELRATSISQCVVSANMGPTYIALAILQIYEVVYSCGQFPEHREWCAINVFQVLQSLVWAVQFLAALAIECPVIGNKNAECILFVADLVASIAGFSPAVVGISEYCQPQMISSIR